uniref:EH domain-containing protein n=1 Tax=Parascaris univalens TaxID=6257 RepID=A0A915CC65_PARUN
MHASGAKPPAENCAHLTSSANTLNMMQQMHYNAGIPIRSNNGLLKQGGGVVPPALLEESRVPRFYQEAIASCGAANVSQLPNTALVYNLMVTSRLPRAVLGNIWSLVNRTLPGQLTRQEFFSCLALIALAQRGQSLSALSNVSMLPIPHFQACAAFPSHYFQGEPTADHHIAVVCTSTAPPASTHSIPVQLGVPFTHRKQPSSTASAMHKSVQGFNGASSDAASNVQMPHPMMASMVSDSKSTPLSPTVVTASSSTNVINVATNCSAASEAESMPQASQTQARPLSSTASSKLHIPHSLTTPAVSHASLPPSAAPLTSGTQIPRSMTAPIASNAYAAKLAAASAYLASHSQAHYAGAAGSESAGCNLYPSVSSSFSSAAAAAGTQRMPPFIPTALLNQSASKIGSMSGSASGSGLVDFTDFRSPSASMVSAAQMPKHSNVLHSSNSCDLPGDHSGVTQVNGHSLVDTQLSLSDNSLSTSSSVQQSNVNPDASLKLFDLLTSRSSSMTPVTSHKNDVDLLCGITFGKSATTLGGDNSEITSLTATNNVVDQFGDFASSKPINVPSGAQLLTPQPITPVRVRCEGSPSGRKEAVDIYAAMKAVEGDFRDNETEGECLRIWERCIAEAHRLLKEGDTVLPPFCEETIEAVVRTERGARYLAALEAVYDVVSRIRKGRSEDLKKLCNELREIDGIWARLKKYVAPTEREYVGSVSFNGILPKRCGICLSEICEDALLEFAGIAYHKQCANLWINRVDSLLPRLS